MKRARLLHIPLTFLALLLAGLAMSGSATGQEQERKLVERLLRPDRDLTYTPDGNSAYVLREFQGTRSASSTPFFMKKWFGDKEFRSKQFSVESFTARQYFQSETAFLVDGEPVFVSSENANVQEMLERDYGTETPVEATQTAPDAERDYVKSGESFYDVKSATVRGTAQGAIDRQYRRDQPAMTIDEVRDLLNKNE